MDLEKYNVVEVLENDENKTFYAVLIKFLKFPKSKIMKHIRKGDIRLNKEKVLFSCRVKVGEKIYIYRPLVSNLEIKEKIEDLDFNLDISEFTRHIVYEDKDLLVLNKEKGILVHDGNYSLDFMANFYLLKENLKSLSFKPSAAHRLDRNTSGLIIFAKNVRASRTLSKAFREGNVTKKYYALLAGEIKSRLVFQDYLARDKQLKKTFVVDDKSGFKATTIIDPILNKSGVSLVQISILTGFTHQIRSQCAFHLHALVGDKKYSSKYTKSNYFLHSFLLKFNEDLFLKNEFYVEPAHDFLKKIRNVFGVYDFKQIF